MKQKVKSVLIVIFKWIESEIVESVLMFIIEQSVQFS